MRILLIGGTGVLSSAVAKASVYAGHCVSSITRGRRMPEPGVEAFICDCRDYQALNKILGRRSFDVVVDFLSFNARQVEDAYRYFSRISSQYIFISSAFVYDFTVGGVFHEKSPRRFNAWKYSIGKADAEDKLLAMQNDDCRVTIVRPMVTYGDTRIPYGLAPRHGYAWTLVARIKAGKPIPIWNGGQNRCTIMRTDEFAVGIVGLIGNKRAYGETFNICGDETPRWLDVLNGVARYAKCSLRTVDLPVEYISRNYPEKCEEIYGRSVDAIVDNSKIKQVVPQFKQSVFIEEGVARTLKSYEDHAYKAGIDWDYDGFCDKLIVGAGLNARFVDYLGDATFRDKYTYWQSRYNGTLTQKLVSFGIRGLAKIRRCLNVEMRRVK